MSRFCIFLAIVLLTTISSINGYAGESVFLYEKHIGGPYVDVWYLTSDSTAGNSGRFNYKLERGGKSGEFEVPFFFDCQTERYEFSTGIMFGSEAVPIKEMKEVVPDEVIRAVFQKACGK